MEIFDDRLIPPLVSTLLELFQTYQHMKGLIAATIRKEETLEKFVRYCSMCNVFWECLGKILTLDSIARFDS